MVSQNKQRVRFINFKIKTDTLNVSGGSFYLKLKGQFITTKDSSSALIVN